MGVAEGWVWKIKTPDKNITQPSRDLHPFATSACVNRAGQRGNSHHVIDNNIHPTLTDAPRDRNNALIICGSPDPNHTA
jgi:hypothetical protein